MLIPHLHFRGNCEEAIAQYEKAFNTKTDLFFHNGNGDGSVGHAEMRIHGSRVWLNDGMGVAYDHDGHFPFELFVTFDSAEELMACYELLKDERVTELPFAAEENVSSLVGAFTDRFGTQWGFMVEETQ